MNNSSQRAVKPIKRNSLAVLGVAHQVEMSHTDFTEVTGMVLVEVDSVVVLTTSKTSTSPVTTLSVLANTTLAMGDVAAHLSGLFISSHHDPILV